MREPASDGRRKAGMKLRDYMTRSAETAEDLRDCQRLRYRAFFEARGLTLTAGIDLDRDDFDAACRHVMIHEKFSGRLVCCFRLMPFASAAEIERSYSARWYDLGRLHDYPGRVVEMGRFCIHPDWKDPAVLRVALIALARFVDEEGIALLFGCSSFQGTDALIHADAFSLLKERHLAPGRWRPRVKAPDVFRFASLPPGQRPDMGVALGHIPPLLRSYLGLGGWVSDHAVIDRDLETLHVFTGVEVARVPASRARLLRQGWGRAEAGRRRGTAPFRSGPGS